MVSQLIPFDRAPFGAGIVVRRLFALGVTAVLTSDYHESRLGRLACDPSVGHDFRIKPVPPGKVL